MILSTREIIERYPDGRISYVETRAVIAPLWIAKYENRRKSPDGTLWIRIGSCRKYNSDGTLRWELLYDNDGNLIKN